MGNRHCSARLSNRRALGVACNGHCGVVFVSARHDGVWAYGRLGVAVARLSQYKKGAEPIGAAPARHRNELSRCRLLTCVCQVRAATINWPWLRRAGAFVLCRSKVGPSLR
jgi:hypothetical protein